MAGFLALSQPELIAVVSKSEVSSPKYQSLKSAFFLAKFFAVHWLSIIALWLIKFLIPSKNGTTLIRLI